MVYNMQNDLINQQKLTLYNCVNAECTGNKVNPRPVI